MSFPIRFLPAIAALLFSTSAEPKPSCYIEADFRPAGQGLRELGLRTSLMAASPRLELINGRGQTQGTCASVFVSNAGHLLTAGHCMEKCLLENGALKPDNNGALVDRERLGEITCQVLINGKKTEVKVLAQSNCTSEDFYAKESRKNCDGLDYALLSPVSALKPDACVGVSQLAHRVNQRIASIGYPIRTVRKVTVLKSQDSKGDGLYVADGKVMPLTAGCRSRTQDTLVPFRYPYLWDKVKLWAEAGQIVQTDTDAVEGMSGGAVVDVNSGQLVGIGNMGLGSTKYEECIGSTFITPIARIQNDMAKRFPGVKPSTWNCTDSAVKGIDATDL